VTLAARQHVDRQRRQRVRVSKRVGQHIHEVVDLVLAVVSKTLTNIQHLKSRENAQ
jgi:hypothetical protein